MPTPMKGLLALTVGLLCFAAPAGAAAQQVDPEVDRIRTANLAIQARIRTALMREVLHETRYFSLDEKRMQRTQQLVEARHESARAAAASGLSPDQVRALELRPADIDHLEDTLRVESLNASTSVRRMTALKTVGPRIRRDDHDLRDLDSLAREHSLDTSQRMSLTRSRSVIMDGDRPEVVLHHHAGRLATLMPFRDLHLESELRKFGVIPPWVFGGEYSLTCETPAGSTEVRLVGRVAGSDGPAIVVDVSPELGYAMTGFTLWRDGRVVDQYRASDFREIDGVFVPFKSRRVLSHSRPEQFVAERSVEEVRINQALADGEIFSVPGNYRLSDLNRRPKIQDLE